MSIQAIQLLDPNQNVDPTSLTNNLEVINDGYRDEAGGAEGDSLLTGTSFRVEMPVTIGTAFYFVGTGFLTNNGINYPIIAHKYGNQVQLLFSTLVTSSNAVVAEFQNGTDRRLYFNCTYEVD